jgi:hypothetical protein
MNQFKSYETQLKNCSKSWIIANDFDFILNNIWCTYSFEKGKNKWLGIKSMIPEPYKSKIDTEIYHVEAGHGINQARLAVKDEMQKYIDYLVGVMKS